MDVVVTGIGLISALGTLGETWHKLLAGASGIGYYQPFADLPPRPLALVGQQPTTPMALLDPVVSAALQDAQLAIPQPDCGVVIGSSRNQQSQWEQLHQSWRSPLAQPADLAIWPETLPHMLAIATARHIGATGPVLAPMAACATGLWAIAQGYELLQTGQCQRVLVGAVEAPISPLTLIGFEKMGALAKTGAYPFDRQREGLVLGEAAVVFVLESAQLARQRSAAVYGRVLGFGLTADGYHVSAPDPNQRGAIAAIKDALYRSSLSPAQIDYIHAHGTATQLNDRNEASLLQRWFADVPVSSTKGATGHTLGASGAVGVALTLMALNDQILPPCVGLRDPEFDLNLVRQAQIASCHHALCLSFGFGGQNVAVALGQ